MSSSPVSSRVEPTSDVTLVTEESIYGTVLVGGMIVASGPLQATSWETFLSVVGTVIVFWAAHMYAGAIARSGRSADGTSLGGAIRTSFRNSLGFLTSALLPCLILLLGATRVVPDTLAIWTALWLGVVILGVIGFRIFARRSENWSVRILGCLGTAAFGLAMIVLKAVIH
jgi:hypothetical protein